MIFLLAALLWQSDWNAAFAQAKQQHKLVFVDYYQNKCGEPCQNVEHLVLPQPAVQKTLSDFVVLKLDLDRSAIPLSHRYAPPAYVVFDADGRERFRIEGEHVLRAVDWHDETPTDPFNDYPFYRPLGRIRTAAPAFVEVAELLRIGRDLDANFLLADIYGRLKMTEHARAAYAEAKKIAERRGNAAAAQSAEIQSAFTYVPERRAAHAVELLKALARAPVNHETEALTWLTLGHAYEAATDKTNAADAFNHALSLAPAGSRAHADAAAGLARVR